LCMLVTAIQSCRQLASIGQFTWAAGCSGYNIRSANTRSHIRRQGVVTLHARNEAYNYISTHGHLLDTV
jgi:hypothetical protein